LTLRIGACLCFVGHGAFGVIGKEAWLPYFAAVGIGPDTGRALEPFWEALERAGNYGVPLALLLVIRFDGRRVREMLTAAVVLLMVGHGALGVIGKHGLVVNYSSILPADTASLVTPYLGWLEIVMALAVLVRPSVGLLIGIAAWKLATESLFLAAGAPVWEVVERGGSYVAPIALALLLGARGSVDFARWRSLRLG
jgi:hypothetical protein